MSVYQAREQLEMLGGGQETQRLADFSGPLNQDLSIAQACSGKPSAAASAGSVRSPCGPWLTRQSLSGYSLGKCLPVGWGARRSLIFIVGAKEFPAGNQRNGMEAW